VPIPDFGGVISMTDCYVFGLDNGNFSVIKL